MIQTAGVVEVTADESERQLFREREERHLPLQAAPHEIAVLGEEIGKHNAWKYVFERNAVSWGLSAAKWGIVWRDRVVLVPPEWGSSSVVA